jgi:hypothetical protein
MAIKFVDPETQADFDNISPLRKLKAKKIFDKMTKSKSTKLGKAILEYGKSIDDISSSFNIPTTKNKAMESEINKYKNILQAATKNKKGLLKLKNALVELQQYEPAMEIRDIEKKYFPESKEEKKAKADAKNMGAVLKMVDLNVSDKTAYILLKTFEAHKKMNGKFDIKTASIIVETANKYFEVL